MATNGIHTREHDSAEHKVMQDVEAKGRDIRDHVLFEISTEAANRGKCEYCSSTS